MPLYHIDLHTHCQGDPLDRLDHTPREHVDRAVAMGLHAIAVTWHRKIFDDPEVLAYARERGLLLIPGMEAEIDGAHVLVLNVQPGDIASHTTCDELLSLRNNPEFFVLAPHPYYPHPTCLGSIIDRHPEIFDGVEWCFYHLPWLPTRINPNVRARAWAQRHGKPLIANSDAHDLDRIGTTYSIVEAEELSIPAIFSALRAGRVEIVPHVFTLADFFHTSVFAIGGQWRFLRRELSERIHGRRAGTP